MPLSLSGVEEHRVCSIFRKAQRGITMTEMPRPALSRGITCAEVVHLEQGRWASRVTDDVTNVFSFSEVAKGAVWFQPSPSRCLLQMSVWSTA